MDCFLAFMEDKEFVDAHCFILDVFVKLIASKSLNPQYQKKVKSVCYGPFSSFLVPDKVPAGLGRRRRQGRRAEDPQQAEVIVLLVLSLFLLCVTKVVVFLVCIPFVLLKASWADPSVPSHRCSHKWSPGGQIR